MHVAANDIETSRTENGTCAPDEETDYYSFLTASSPGPSASQVASQESVMTTFSEADEDGVQIHACDRHNEFFYSEHDYKKHIERFHNTSSRFQCNICDKSYANNFGLNQHTNTTHLGTPYMCSVNGCHKFFKSVKGRNLHEQKHVGVLQFKCDICSFNATSLSALRSHKVSHSASKRFPCRYCPKRFTRTNDRKRHEEKSCPAKGKHFASLSIGVCTDGQDEPKVTSKSGRKGHRCSLCHKTFLTKEKLTSHMTSIHRRERTYACTECMKTFSSRSLLGAHRRDVH